MTRDLSLPAILDRALPLCGEEHPMLCTDPEGELPLRCGLPAGHAGEHQDERTVVVDSLGDIGPGLARLCADGPLYLASNRCGPSGDYESRHWTIASLIAAWRELDARGVTGLRALRPDEVTDEGCDGLRESDKDALEEAGLR